ncbi:hypothetical protein [Arcticibacterium luteifluviistationis]|uniref:Uncharacterized protein n=1 Tax=Arcticibacterium luteifluviistationis TaxID=1784714 RepID=A0A2Z4GCS4_9BACT|nr:hypothetical protein [Arcticibacterium luteifluviistationis]AWV98927.1 hypothetical protein DJ013_12390 [Arcticibacterium luteifluviistationis]
MPKNISKELENAILTLSQKEKDRHLLRLIAKNQLLREQMQFTLLEDESDLGWRREELLDLMSQLFDKPYSYTGILLKDIRMVSAKITWHRRVTKDKYGEAELALVLLEKILANHRNQLAKSHKKAESLRVYVVRKAIAVIKYITALHEDFQIDFVSRMDKVLDQLHTFETKYPAALLQLPKAMD